MAILGGFGRGNLVKSLAGGAALFLAFASIDATPAQARHRHHGFRHHAHSSHHGQRHTRHSRGHSGGESFSPAFAAMVVDGNSGRTLYAKSENELRHPASVTKVMTLFLLFEQLERGKLQLDSEIPISEHAAEQAPSKLGLRPGSTIDVESAIKAVVTKSANDIAVAIAEKVGGDEDTFAELMTRKARELGMTRTHYANASGLPDPEQITTARDLTLLGRAIQERFPRYYRYFSTPSFRYGRNIMRNHNHLLGRVEGMDGIKTGYTRASGFNLLTSVRRGGHWVVGVVLGGTSGPSRDRIMAGLLEEHIDEGSRTRTASVLGESAADRSEVAEAQPARVEPVRLAARPEPKPESMAYAEAPEPVRAAAKTNAAIVSAANPATTASIPPVPQERPRPAFIAGTPKALPSDAKGQTARVILDGSTGRPISASTSAGLTTTPSSMRWVTGAAAVKAVKQEAKIEVAKVEAVRAVALRTEVEDVAPASSGGRPHRPGWMIQIGATDDAGKAQELLSRAQSQRHAGLTSARPFTEKVQKGHETLWRARFAGLEEDSAEAACKSLKRAGFSCFATKN